MDQYQTYRVPRDNILNHLSTALDTEKMKAVFQQQLYSDLSVRIASCTIERIKYKPQKNCHISYRLNFKNKVNQNKEQLLCSRFYEQDGSASRFLKEVNKNNSTSLLHIPELDCVTWVFPNDRKLKNLELITHTDFLYRQVAPKLVNVAYGSDGVIQEFESKMIRYVPEQNCSVRIQMRISHNSGRQQNFLIAYGKTHYNNSGQQTYRIMEQLWHSDQCQKHKLNIPQPLLYDQANQMFWQCGVPGIMLSELVENQALFIDSVSRFAEQIVLLHKIPLQDCPHQNQDNLLQQLDNVGQLLHKLDLPCREQITTLISKLITLAPSLQSEQLATLHGDLHLKNILVDEDKVYLIDLDSISIGNPLLDIGSFVAAIINLGLIRSLPEHLGEQTIQIFLQAYCKKAPWPIRDNELRWYIAASIISERIFRSFTRLKVGRMEIIEDLTRQAEIILDNTFTPSWLQDLRQIS